MMLATKNIQQNPPLGKQGEYFVAQYLEKRGCTICKLNYSCRRGEVDIIAEKGNLRLFIEVKTRQHHYFETSQVITPAKQRKIVATAHYYNAQVGWGEERIHRFDVALLEEVQGAFTITYIPNAFAPVEEHSSW